MKYNVHSNHIEGYPHDNQDICLGHQLMKGKHIELEILRVLSDNGVWEIDCLSLEKLL